MDQLRWHGRCDSSGCVEIAVQGNAVLMRNSAAPWVTLTLTRAEWQDFIRGVKEGLFDRF